MIVSTSGSPRWDRRSTTCWWRSPSSTSSTSAPASSTTPSSRSRSILNYPLWKSAVDQIHRCSKCTAWPMSTFSPTSGILWRYGLTSCFCKLKLYISPSVDKSHIWPSRFPYCVLSYLSLVFVVKQLTNPSHKSYLSWAFNYIWPPFIQNILMSWTTNLTMGLAMERYLAVCRLFQNHWENTLFIFFSFLFSAASALVVKPSYGVSPTSSQVSSTAHSNSVLTFPNNL